MSINTGIEWCTAIWNPIIGCSKISIGCDNCYAEKMAVRLACIEMRGYPDVVTNKKWNGTIKLIESELSKPAKWRRSQIIFVCSMSDFYHPNIESRWRDKIWHVIRENKNHIFLLLTKRPEVMCGDLGRFGPGTFPENVWFGVTVCNQQEADEKIPYLSTLDTKNTFVSIEPMLNRIDLNKTVSFKNRDVCLIDCVNWVICGGETTQHARIMHPEWVGSLYRQTRDIVKIPFFFKQWGEWKSFYNLDKDPYRRFVPEESVYVRRMNVDGETSFHGKCVHYFKKVGVATAGSDLYGSGVKEFPAQLKKVLVESHGYYL